MTWQKARSTRVRGRASEWMLPVGREGGDVPHCMTGERYQAPFGRLDDSESWHR